MVNDYEAEWYFVFAFWLNPTIDIINLILELAFANGLNFLPDFMFTDIVLLLPISY